MNRLYSDFNSLLERFDDYEYNSKGVNKSSVKRSMKDVIYRTMSGKELAWMISNSALQFAVNDILDGRGLKDIDFNVYPYFKSFFRTVTNMTIKFYHQYEVIVEFDRFALKSLPACKLYSLYHLGRER